MRIVNTYIYDIFNRTLKARIHDCLLLLCLKHMDAVEALLFFLFYLIIEDSIDYK